MDRPTFTTKIMMEHMMTREYLAKKYEEELQERKKWLSENMEKIIEISGVYDPAHEDMDGIIVWFAHEDEEVGIMLDYPAYEAWKELGRPKEGGRP